MTSLPETKNRRKRRVLIIGLGDLGGRISQMIAERGLATEIRLASRGDAARQWAEILRLGTGCHVSSGKLDGQNPHAITRV